MYWVWAVLCWEVGVLGVCWEVGVLGVCWEVGVLGVGCAVR